MDKTAIIIGAGIAGLSVGCYAQMNGYRTTIFEMHDKPGGLCTAWQRQGYTFDGCIHWLVGSGPGPSLHRGWLELGALQGKRVINHDEFGRYEGDDGRTFIWYTNLNRLEQHMLDLSPADAAFTREMIAAARRLAHFTGGLDKPPELQTAWEKLASTLKMVPMAPAFMKWGRMSTGAMADRFQDRLLRDAFHDFASGKMPAIFLLMTMGWLHGKSAGYPIGGSLEFARGIEKRYLGLGGEIRYRQRVDKVLVENDRAVGIRLADGSEHRADYVISAADGHTTIFDMLDGRYVDDKIKGYYRDLPRFGAAVQVSLGVRYSFEDLPSSNTGLSFPIAEPIDVGGRSVTRLNVHPFHFDRTMAPEGATTVVVMLAGDYHHWKALRADPDRYAAEKQRIKDEVVAALDRHFPGLAAATEVSDVATPVTFERYTGNWEGDFEGWLPTPKTITLRMSKTLPGLDCFYMVGQWVSPGGGLPSGLMSGREVAQYLCHRDGRRFATTTPS
ncbi:MAG: phytoene desaturase family protein [Anaerolineae bacterium]